MRRLLPADSHTSLNLDKPQRGPLFAFAFAAARKRTEREFLHIQKEILQKTGESGLRYFTGQVETTG